MFILQLGFTSTRAQWTTTILYSYLQPLIVCPPLVLLLIPLSCEPCFLGHWTEEEAQEKCPGCENAPKPTEIKLMKNHFGFGVAPEAINMKEINEA